MKKITTFAFDLLTITKQKISGFESKYCKNFIL